ncbi:MAG: FISUMP domain-containing protein [Cyclobacteriaceae bacterium]|nr:FISUMP domain-containing protein [Cyclobacteriaceae bacterium]
MTKQAEDKEDLRTLYSAYAVKTKKLCPAGWHVPSENDFDTDEFCKGL